MDHLSKRRRLTRLDGKSAVEMAELLQAEPFPEEAVRAFLGGYRDVDAQKANLTPKKKTEFLNATGLAHCYDALPLGRKAVVFLNEGGPDSLWFDIDKKTITTHG